MNRFPYTLAVLLLFTLPSSGQEKQDSPEGLKARIEKLEAENAALKKDLAALKQQVDALVKGAGAERKENKPTEEAQAVKQVGKDFVVDLERDRLASAFGSTSAAFQKRTERKAFDDLVAQHAEVRTLIQVPEFREEKVKKLTADKGYDYYFTAPMFGSNKLVNVALRIVKEDNEWKVDDVEIRSDK
jgi:hypothetical protein